MGSGRQGGPPRTRPLRFAKFRSRLRLRDLELLPLVGAAGGCTPGFSRRVEVDGAAWDDDVAVSLRLPDEFLRRSGLTGPTLDEEGAEPARRQILLDGLLGISLRGLLELLLAEELMVLFLAERGGPRTAA